jgi:hypothetical protein
VSSDGLLLDFATATAASGSLAASAMAGCMSSTRAHRALSPLSGRMFCLPARTWMPRRWARPLACSHSPPKARTVRLIGTSPLSSAAACAENRGAAESCAGFR